MIDEDVWTNERLPRRRSWLWPALLASGAAHALVAIAWLPELPALAFPALPEASSPSSMQMIQLHTLPPVEAPVADPVVVDTALAALSSSVAESSFSLPEPVPEPAPEPVREPEPAPEPAPVPDPVPEPEIVLEPIPEPELVPEPQAEPEEAIQTGSEEIDLPVPLAELALAETAASSPPSADKDALEQRLAQEGRAQQRVIDAYKTELLGRMAAAMQYPRRAQRQNLQGIVEVQFTVHAESGVEGFEILLSSGQRVLDDAARQLILRDMSLPDFPAELLAASQETLHFAVPIEYRLN